MNEEHPRGPDAGRAGPVRHPIDMAVPFVVYMKEAKEAGVPDRVAFRRYARRVREDAVRSVERPARERLGPAGSNGAKGLREDLGRERRRADRLEEEVRELRDRLADAEGRQG